MGAGAGGAGGDVTFSASTIKAINSVNASLNVVRGDSGAVDFQAGTLNATEGWLTVSFIGTDLSAGDTVTIGNLVVGNGQQLGVNTTGGEGIITGSLTVLAYNFANPSTLATSIYAGSGAAATDFTGKTINFVFPETIAAGNTVLTAANIMTADNSTRVTLSMVGGGTPSWPTATRSC